MNKFNKKEIKYYNDNFEKIMQLVNAKKIKEFDYIIESNYGKVNIYKDDLNLINVGILGINMQFEDIKKSIKFHEDSYCGKWNYCSTNIIRGLKILYLMLYKIFDGHIDEYEFPELKTNKFTNATVYYINENEKQSIECTKNNLTRTVNKLKKCSWIHDIEVVKYNFD